MGKIWETIKLTTERPCIVQGQTAKQHMHVQR